MNASVVAAGGAAPGDGGWDLGAKKLDVSGALAPLGAASAAEGADPPASWFTGGASPDNLSEAFAELALRSWHVTGHVQGVAKVRDEQQVDATSGAYAATP